jgi:HEAT repeat protein
VPAQLLLDAQELVQGGAVESLINSRYSEVGERDYVVARLLEGLENDDVEIQFLSAETLGKLGDPSVIPAIEKLLEDDWEDQEEDEYSRMARKAVERLRSAGDWTVEEFDPSEDKVFDILEGLIEEMRETDAARKSSY